MTIPTKPICAYNPERVCRGQCFHCHDEDEAVAVPTDDTDTNPFVQLRMDDERSE